MIKQVTVMALVGCLIFSGSAKAGEIVNDENQTHIYDIVEDPDQLDVKKIVAEVEQDGSFRTEDLGSWIEEEKVCTVSLLKEEKDEARIVFYEFDQSTLYKLMEDNNVNNLTEWGMVSVGDVIRCTSDCIETVIWVDYYGNFFTVQELVGNIIY